jgi:DNA-binding NtrC family response regulator
MSEATILLVDDEKTVLDSLKQQLRRAFGRRFSYETAENVSEAWEIIEELDEARVRLVVVVSDWLMPEVKGDEFLSELCRRHPQVVRIMLTGQADPEAVARAYGEAKVAGVLSKPWRIEELSELIEAGVGD